MKVIIAVLVISCFTTTTVWAQSLQELKAQYDALSPLPSERLATEKTLAPEESDKTPAEEQLAELKAQEEAATKAREEALYLDTDYRFFQSLDIVIGEDELDKKYQQAKTIENLKQIITTDQTVRSEIKTIAPQVRPLSAAEAAAADARREQILKRIAAHTKSVKACIVQNLKDKEPFKGTELTLAWELEATGKVANAKVKATDIESQLMQACILKSLADWDFSEAMKGVNKTSQVEYTYRFTNEVSKNVAAQQN